MPQSGAGFALVLTPDGMALEVGGARVVVGKPLRTRVWYRVWASADPATGMLRVGQQPLKRAFAVDDEGEAQTTAPTPCRSTPPQPILIGAEPATDRPAAALLQRQDRGAGDRRRRRLGLRPPHGESMEIEDTGPNGLHGRLVNLPTRAMKGAAWTGAERDWRRAPHHYAAIHFHDDDLHDCGWADDFSFTVPKDMTSGVYGMQLSCGTHRDVIPFFVRPAGRQAAGQGLLPRLDLHLSGLLQLLARRVRRGVPQARRRLEGLSATIPTTTRTTASRPTTITATARAWPTPRTSGRCSPGGRIS